MTPKRFNALVFAHAKAEGRHALPWRATTDPYRILVSEVMLQQTQVERVIPYYERFLKRFPSVADLAQAPLSDVLLLWQGLGYNRRAKMLHEAAKVVMNDFGGRIPETIEELEALPGVGHYTARAVAAFSSNLDVIFIETNIRTAVIHAFFPDKETVSDRDVMTVLEKSFPRGRAREWYSALMDYGASLKRQGVRVNTKSTAYTKQKAFEGSSRQARGAILRTLLLGPKREAGLLTVLGAERSVQVKDALAALHEEGLVERVRGAYRLPR